MHISGFSILAVLLTAIGQSAVAHIDLLAESLLYCTDSYNRIRNILKLVRLLAFEWMDVVPRRRDLRPQFYWSARFSTTPWS
jgi:hypothetical protein